MNNEIFNKKADLLCAEVFSHEKEIGEFSKICGRYAAFISICDIGRRAFVFRASANSPRAAWENARADATQFVFNEDIEPIWMKVDITKKGERALFSDVLGELAKGRSNVFRRGIAFDDTLDAALIEAELNCRGVIDYKKKTLDLLALNKVLAEREIRTLTQFPDEVILFDCESAFCDEKNNVYELYSDGSDCGRRKKTGFTKDDALRVLATATDFLSMQVGLDGKFDYGFYPASNKAIPGYNIVRHAGSVWELLYAYRVLGDKFILGQAESAINFMIRNSAYKYPKRDAAKENTVYLFDSIKDEVKIGGNAIAIIALTEYMDVVKTDKYVRLATELGNGILELFDERYGSFFHVLRYPSLAPRDKFRTVYYDGETVFALCRLYGLTRQKRFLDAARSAADRFIKKDYTKYADHWVAYAINELIKFIPDEKYMNFGLKNVTENLERIYKQKTSYHTFLELLGVSAEMYFYILEKKPGCEGLKTFDAKRFAETIFHRAEFMLNGYAYPEFAMYFKHPSNALGAFFVRHDDFRVRIDDIQHFCGGYYLLYKNFDRIRGLMGGAESR